MKRTNRSQNNSWWTSRNSPVHNSICVVETGATTESSNTIPANIHINNTTHQNTPNIQNKIYLQNNKKNQNRKKQNFLNGSHGYVQTVIPLQRNITDLTLTVISNPFSETKEIVKSHIASGGVLYFTQKLVISIFDISHCDSHANCEKQKTKHRELSIFDNKHTGLSIFDTVHCNLSRHRRLHKIPNKIIKSDKIENIKHMRILCELYPKYDKMHYISLHSKIHTKIHQNTQQHTLLWKQHWTQYIEMHRYKKKCNNVMKWNRQLIMNKIVKQCNFVLIKNSNLSHLSLVKQHQLKQYQYNKQNNKKIQNKTKQKKTLSSHKKQKNHPRVIKSKRGSVGHNAISGARLISFLTGKAMIKNRNKKNLSKKTNKIKTSVSKKWNNYNLPTQQKRSYGLQNYFNHFHHTKKKQKHKKNTKKNQKQKNIQKQLKKFKKHI